jgi:hypothetical protein
MSRELNVFASLSDLSIFYPSRCSLKLDSLFLNYGSPLYSYNPALIDIGDPQNIDFVGFWSYIHTCLHIFP